MGFSKHIIKTEKRFNNIILFQVVAIILLHSGANNKSYAFGGENIENSANILIADRRGPRRGAARGPRAHGPRNMNKYKGYRKRRSNHQIYSSPPIYRKHYKTRNTLPSNAKFIPFSVEVTDVGIETEENQEILQISTFSDFLDLLETQYDSCEAEITTLKVEYPALKKLFYQTLGECNKTKNLKLIGALYKANLGKDFKNSEHELLIKSVLEKNILFSQKYDNHSITKEEYEISWETHTEKLQELTKKIFITNNNI